MEKANELSREMQWFMETLRTKFRVEVASGEIGYESVELALEEVGQFFVPLELPGTLPETILYDLMVVDDVDGNVWVGAIAYHPGSPDWCLQAITKNDGLVLRNALPRPSGNSRQN